MSEVTRRGAIAGGLILTSAKTAFTYQANSKVRLAILGTGNRGAYVGKFFSQDARTEIVAMCDLYADQIDKAKTAIPSASGAAVFKDAGEMIGKGGFDAIQITTPVYLHPEHFEMAVKADKHIYCEKPAGASIAGVKRLMAAAKASKPEKVVFFGFQQRWSPEYLAAEKILRSGQLGELLLMRAEWMVGGIRLKQRPEAEMPKERLDRMWYPWRAKSGDFIVEQDCHGVDVLNWFAQAHPVKAIAGAGKGRRPYGDNLDHVNVTYTYPGGLCGYLHGTQLIQKGYGVVREEFFGSEGSIETNRKYYKWMKGPGDVVNVTSKREITIDAIELFLTHILEGKKTNMAFDAGTSTLTALLGRMAADTQREVTWDEMMKSE